MQDRRASVGEAPFRIEVNGATVGSGTCTPARVAALAAGWLLAEGLISRREDLLTLEIIESDDVLLARAGVNAAVVARAAAERAHRSVHGCGPLYFVRCAPELLAAPERVAGELPIALLPERFRELFAAESDREIGGIHSAALCDGARLYHQAEDVGRHNAVDKAIGAGVLDGLALPRFGLVLSARISAAIAVKAARARLAWLASRSIPTTLALEVARAAGLPIIGRAAGPQPAVHLPEAGAISR